MSQEEVLAVLKEKSKAERDKWFSFSEIKDALVERGVGNGTLERTLSRCLERLVTFGIIRVRWSGTFYQKKVYRAKLNHG